MSHESLVALLTDAVEQARSVDADCEYRPALVETGEVSVTNLTVRFVGEPANARLLLGNLLRDLERRARPATGVNLELFVGGRTVVYSGRMAGRNFNLIVEMG